MDERPFWKRVIGGIFDFLTAFLGFGFLIAYLSGQTTSNGFSLQGGSALVLLGCLVAYFVIGNRTGGTVWQRILRIPPPRK